MHCVSTYLAVLTWQNIEVTHFRMIWGGILVQEARDRLNCVGQKARESQRLSLVGLLVGIGDESIGTDCSIGLVIPVFESFAGARVKVRVILKAFEVVPVPGFSAPPSFLTLVSFSTWPRQVTSAQKTVPPMWDRT
jgi:hypothetical protein